MSEPPRYQLGLFGGEEPVLVGEAARVVEEIVAKPARREVSAEREMRAAQSSLAISLDPPDIEGWREELGRERPRIVRGVCTAIEDWRRLDDGTIGPCPWADCSDHLLIDRGQVVTIRGRCEAELVINRAGEDPAMGRRPALSATPTDGEVDDFALAALVRLGEIPDTCMRDVIARHRGEVPVEEVARVLGISEEQVRIDSRAGEVETGMRWNGLVPDPNAPGYYVGAPSPRAKIRRTWRGKVGKPSRAPAGKRIEREAPPVRDPGADEIFTF